MRVALVGPPQSGKTTLFTAVATVGGSHVHLSHGDQPNVAVVKVPDERLDWLAEHFQAKKATPAELEFVDLPGLDLSTEAGRHHARVHWGTMRQSDMLVFVVRGFEAETAATYRGRVAPDEDVDELLAEMLFADLDQVTSRVEKLEAAARKPTADRNEQLKELELMKRLKDALENERPIADALSSEAEAKLVRSFAFLSQRPTLAVVNCSEADLGAGDRLDERPPRMRLSARIESEIAQLEPAERAEFLSDLGVNRPAGDRLVRACYDQMGLVTFLTYTGGECRAWTVPAGTEAVVAAEKIHSDIARGFIRAETVGFDDLKASGDMKAAKAAGKVRLEGKQSLVRDGDVITFRFNV